MSRAKDHSRENQDQHVEIPEQKAASERKEHAEERELPPEIPVEPVANPEGAQAAGPYAPGSRFGDQR